MFTRSGHSAPAHIIFIESVSLVKYPVLIQNAFWNSQHESFFLICTLRKPPYKTRHRMHVSNLNYERISNHRMKVSLHFRCIWLLFTVCWIRRNEFRKTSRTTKQFVVFIKELPVLVGVWCVVVQIHYYFLNCHWKFCIVARMLLSRAITKYLIIWQDKFECTNKI